MTEPTANTSRRGARTFRAACVVLASVAVAQAATTAWSSKTSGWTSNPPAPVQAADPKPADRFSAAVSEPDPYPEMQTPAGEPPPYDPALAGPGPVMSVPKAPAPLDVPITDESVLVSLDEALHLRSQGDMQGSLTRLREALKKLPDHPRLLYQTARTLDTMGLTQKADPFWKTLRKLGKGAGDFYVLARERMAEGPQTTPEPEEPTEGKFTIVDLRDERISNTVDGERVRFTAVLKKNTTEPLALQKLAEDMVLAIHFFDTVNRGRLARSQVAQPELTCVSEPLDWTEDTESFTFEYWQPDMSPEQMKRFGRCKYFGCALEVIYKNQLQDTAATTPILVQCARELPLPAPEPVDAILDSLPGQGPQPESGLFPPMLKP